MLGSRVRWNFQKYGLLERRYCTDIVSEDIGTSFPKFHFLCSFFSLRQIGHCSENTFFLDKPFMAEM